jgi:Fe2+ or Zn2+ uptake regulation protein
MQAELIRRPTKQRNIILEELRKVKIHPTADAVFKMARRRLPRVSFGTVYRNLNLLRDEGKILELTCGKYSCRYDGNTTNHYHFFCLSCKKVFDLHGPIIANLNKKISRKSGVTVKYHRIDFYGYCKSCKEKTKFLTLKGRGD